MTPLIAAALAAALVQEPLPEVVLAGDDLRIARSCRLVVPAGRVVEDANGDGVVHVVADGVRLELAPGSVLRGAPDAADPDTLAGCGVRIEGRSGVTLAGFRVRGFKAGLWATAAPGLVLEDCDVSDNFRQRLRSTPRAEDGADWLWPHENDANQWLERYGAGVWIEDSAGVVVRRVRARRVQNGVVLDRVTGAQVYDCDLSFLSGWGLALWRTSDSVISRNALDFCVRGYSHGVYNRGQDSAGLLMFEQCRENLVVRNSITHGGDGVFAFSGREALGEGPVPEGFDHAGAGNAGNVFAHNDLSYAAAHGLELTFAFDNFISDNRFVENAICGVWGGYSQRTEIGRNEFARNGQAGYGAERGGVNIEHGRANVVAANRFEADRCGVRLWWDPDEGLAQTPWARANGVACAGNRVQANTFVRNEVAVELVECQASVVAGNRFEDCGVDVRDEPASVVAASPPAPALAERDWPAPGEAEPVGARAGLRGRDKIVMTEWGPWDHAAPIALRRAVADRELDVQRPDDPSPAGGLEAWELRGFDGLPEVRVAAGAVSCDWWGGADAAPSLLVGATEAGGVVPYSLELTGGGLERPLRLDGVLHAYDWSVTWFPAPVDPREDPAAWRAAAAGPDAVTQTVARLDLPYGGGGPAGLALPGAEARAALPGDHFGTVARASVTLPAGRWRVVATSDDGVRVRADEQLLIDNWTWHGPTRDEALLELAEPRTVGFEVEHFELDGWSVLALAIEPAGA